MCQNKFQLSFSLVILNVVKDLPFIYAFRRFFAHAQNDRVIVILHSDTPSSLYFYPSGKGHQSTSGRFLPMVRDKPRKTFTLRVFLPRNR